MAMVPEVQQLLSLPPGTVFFLRRVIRMWTIRRFLRLRSRLAARWSHGTAPFGEPIVLFAEVEDGPGPQG